MPAPATDAVRRLVDTDAASFRELRLVGLKTCAEAFGATWEEEHSRPLGWFAERLTGNIVIGGFDARERLVGTAAVFPSTTPKTRHKGTVWGVFVSPSARGAGLAGILLKTALSQAAHVVEEARLSVGTSNAAAVRLYERTGFVQYGMEPRAIKVGERYYDEYLMRLSLTS